MNTPSSISTCVRYLPLLLAAFEASCGGAPDAPSYRVAVASFQHETCTFCPGGDIGADDWRVRLVGDEVLTSGSYVRGFVAQATDYGDMELVGLRSPSGVFGGSSRSWNTREAFDGFLDAMIEDLKTAMPVDGVYLALPGTFDLHGNEDARFLEHADFAFVTKRYPHYDAAVQGGRAARAIHRVMSGTYNATTATRKPGVITATVLQWTGQSPETSSSTGLRPSIPPRPSLFQTSHSTRPCPTSSRTEGLPPKIEPFSHLAQPA